MIDTQHKTQRIPRAELKATASRRFATRGLWALSGFLLLWSLLHAGCGTPVCRSNDDCEAPTPYCVLAQCHQCTEDQHCPVGQYCDRQGGVCRAPGSESGGGKEVVGNDNADASTDQPKIDPDTPKADAPPDTPQVTEATPKDERPPADQPTPDTVEGDCQSGQTRPCYTGPANTKDKGTCKAGTQTCQNNKRWGACTGEILPTDEACDGKDNDCDGSTDETWPTLGQECNRGVGGCGSKGKFVCPPDGSSNAVCDATPSSPTKEVCDGKDNNCDGKIDETFPGKGKDCTVGKGLCQNKGKQICTKDGTALTCDATPKAANKEICDGKDNDCDGQTDEGIPCNCKNGDTRACGTNEGACKEGKQTCKDGTWSTTCTGEVKGTTESCNGIDDDCDGKTDETLNRPCFTGAVGCRQTSSNKFTCAGTCTTGFQNCANGSWGRCTGQVSPTAELCNGKDDDCDGQTDENFTNLGSACSAGLGECKRSGKWICASDGKNVACNVKAGSPQAEICNGKDDDCDGQTDETPTNVGQACNTGKKGACSQGKQICNRGKLECLDSIMPSTEICDGKDNDCDGQTDESVPGTGVTCSTGKAGICKSGEIQCRSAKLTCVPDQQPVTEICRDQQDNDCDGNVDEICGPQHAYAVVDSTGRRLGGNLTVTRLFTGRYSVRGVNGLCRTVPAFATAISTGPHSVTYSCGASGIGFAFYAHGNNGLVNAGLSIVVPDRSNGEIYGIVDEEDCYRGTNKRCDTDADYGNATVYEVSQGVYEIDATPCSNPTQPLFITPRRGNTSARITYTIGRNNSRCVVRIYDAGGSLISNRFAYWLPNSKANAYAITNGSGFAASQNFNDQNAKWALKVNPPSSTSGVTYDVTFHAFANPSAVLVSPIQILPAPAQPSQLMTLQGIKGGAKVYVFDEGQGPPTPSKAATFHVLFVQ